MAEVLRLTQLLKALRDRAAKTRVEGNASVIVGYSQSYGIFVHENLEAHHPVGQAQFLLHPARENADKYAKIATDQLQKGRTMAQSLVLAGLSLQGDSQRLVPVDTGALRSSAFTRLETQ